MPILGTVASGNFKEGWSLYSFSPFDTYLGLTSSPSMIVAGTDNVYLSSSPTGTTWTQRNPPTAARFWTGSWSDTLNLFVYFTFNSTNCVTSPDGITWTLRVQPTSFYRTSIFAGGKFVAIGANQVPMCVSTDGITFTSGSMPAAVYWLDVAYNGTTYCAVSNNNTPNVVATSTNGTAWTARATPYNSMSGVEWNGTVFCAITAAGGNQSMTSPDGITWTTRTLPLSLDWSAITWNGTYFTVVANGSATVITSPDGVNWTVRDNLFVLDQFPRLIWTGSKLVALSQGYAGVQITSSAL